MCFCIYLQKQAGNIPRKTEIKCPKNLIFRIIHFYESYCQLGRTVNALDVRVDGHQRAKDRCHRYLRNIPVPYREIQT
jgi:hypothetical protein